MQVILGKVGPMAEFGGDQAFLLVCMYNSCRSEIFWMQILG